jgi:hypothetical protein
MATGLRISRSRSFLMAAMVGLVSTAPAWAENAVAPVGAPFAQSRELADAELAQLRGGFESQFDSLVKIPFGLDVQFASMENGQKIASLNVTNHNNPSQTVKVDDNNVKFTFGAGPIPQSAIDQVTTTMTTGTNVTTTLTPSGIVTLIQNTRPNITLQTLQTLKVNITGLQGIINTQAHTSARPFSVFH